MGEVTSPLYFGCLGDTGHYLWDMTGRKIHTHPLGGSRTPAFLDSMGLLVEMYREGEVVVTHIDIIWTLFGWKDYSVDTRPGSHSLFLFGGHVEYAAAMTMIQDDFPTVLDRQRTSLTRVGT